MTDGRFAEERYDCPHCERDVTARLIEERDTQLAVFAPRRPRGPGAWSVWLTCLCGGEFVVEGTWAEA